MPDLPLLYFSLHLKPRPPPSLTQKTVTAAPGSLYLNLGPPLNPCPNPQSRLHTPAQHQSDETPQWLPIALGVRSKPLTTALVPGWLALLTAPPHLCHTLPLFLNSSYCSVSVCFTPVLFFSTSGPLHLFPQFGILFPSSPRAAAFSFVIQG